MGDLNRHKTATMHARLFYDFLKCAFVCFMPTHFMILFSACMLVHFTVEFSSRACIDNRTDTRLLQIMHANVVTI